MLLMKSAPVCALPSEQGVPLRGRKGVARPLSFFKNSLAAKALARDAVMVTVKARQAALLKIEAGFDATAHLLAIALAALGPSDVPAI